MKRQRQPWNVKFSYIRLDAKPRQLFKKSEQKFTTSVLPPVFQNTYSSIRTNQQTKAIRNENII